ncbi:MAG: hypothetical protein HYY10_02045 [Candidatus Liptonbacteria bacterium]|nr:hypothetical protein [Candidatus Liptonbacteria bacterium]
MKFNLESVIKTITKPWTPVALDAFDDKVLWIAMFHGEYHEHSHEYDEFFWYIAVRLPYGQRRGILSFKRARGIRFRKE